MTQQVASLDSTVEILRDEYGIPHVRASTARDAFWGQGYATAADRLFHIDLDRKRGAGRSAEWFGSSAVGADTLMRRFELVQAAHRDFAALDASSCDMLSAYSAGVNAAAMRMLADGRLPLEYKLLGCEPEQWEPWHCLLVFQVRHVLMGGHDGKLWRARLLQRVGAEEAARLYTGFTPGQPLIVPPSELFSGSFLNGLNSFTSQMGNVEWMMKEVEGANSNSFALAGQHTASGLPLVAGDPHRGCDAPSVYYQNHVQCPEFDVIGLSFPGVPGFPHYGHNGHVCWGITSAMIDNADLFIERCRNSGNTTTADPREWEYEGPDNQWMTLKTRTETILVRDSKPVVIELFRTRHGPVLCGHPSSGCVVSVQYTHLHLEANPLGRVLREMLLCTSAAQLDECMGSWVDPTNNMVIADTEGALRYLTRGLVPIRHTTNAWLPVPGWEADYDWRGTVAHADMPRCVNPPEGLLYTANNRIVGDEYPYHLSLDYVAGWRAQRLLLRLRSAATVSGGATVSTMQAIHRDCVSMPALTLAPLLATAKPLAAEGVFPAIVFHEAQAELRSWNGSMDRSSIAASIYSASRLHMHQRVMLHLLGDVSEHDNAWVWGASGHFRQLEAALITHVAEGNCSLLPPEAPTWPDMLSLALTEGLAWLITHHGFDLQAWRWGALHVLRPQHPLAAAFPDVALNPPAVAIDGDGDTVQCGAATPAATLSTGLFEASATSVARWCFDLGDWNNSRWVVPLGSSGQAAAWGNGDQHVDDQREAWVAGVMVPMLYHEDVVRAATKSRLVFEPPSRL